MKFRTVWGRAALCCFLLSGCDGGSEPDPDAGPELDADVTPGCPTGTELCDGECIDTSGDRANCGACGNACGADEACVDGACDVLCPATQVECGGACVDLDTDRAHCGACGTACGTGEICVGGACEISCPGDQVVCGGACVDTQSNPAHCGACGAACGAGEVCDSGVCAATCGAGLTDCGGACVDTANSPDHCGACDAACAPADGASGLCMAGSCRLICEPLLGDCNGDLLSGGGDGCETSLHTDVNNCGACARVCSVTNAVAGCAAGDCTVASCDAGFGDCDADASNGCETPTTDDDMNCGGCGITCTADERCVATTCTPMVADTCSNAWVLSEGANSVAWTAFGTEYITSAPSCSFSGPDGADLVLSYTATADEEVTVVFDKPDSTRWAAVVSDAACGTLTPELACASEYTGTTMEMSFSLLAGTTAYIYVVDTTSGSDPLDNPLSVTVNSINCAVDPPPGVTELSPVTGGDTVGPDPIFRATFEGPIDPSVGTVTITGDMGTALSYDLSTSPAEVSFSAGDTVMEIDPAVGLTTVGETLTISWTGLQDATCMNTVAPPTWTVNVTPPPCSPGVGGVVGTTMTRIPSGLSSFTEYYVAADSDPSGYVYVGGNSSLYRLPKAGGTVEDIDTIAALASTHLGYDMLVSGSEIYTLESSTSGTTGHLFRISTDGGASWAVQNYATFPTEPGDDFRGITEHGGRIYMVTQEFSTTADTEIWSVPLGATSLPVMATLETTFTGWAYCTGIARDASFYYVACSTDDAILRIPVGGGAPELVTSRFTTSSTKDSLHGDDLDGDDVFDVLYHSGQYEEINYICDPAGAPYPSELVDQGGSSGNYGLGFDPVNGVLWTFDDDTGVREFIRTE